jgi:hypothetical protein
MADDNLGYLKDYGPRILSVCIILYSLFLLYLTDIIENEDDYENF